jgi:hypothetical protein
MNTSDRLNPFTRGITGVSKGPCDLAVPLETPTGQEGIYQLGAFFQLSDKQSGMFCNIRRASVHANDLEMGSDLVMFDDLNAICSDNAITLIRGEEMDHPETGERMILSTYTLRGRIRAGRGQVRRWDAASTYRQRLCRMLPARLPRQCPGKLWSFTPLRTP